MWNLPGPGMEPMSPELAGRFLSTVFRQRNPAIIVDAAVSFFFFFFQLLKYCLEVREVKLVPQPW